MNTEQERALLPCPFCGSTNIEIQISTPDREGVPTNLMCSDCGSSGPWEYEQGNSHAKVDDAWNRRAALQPQEAAKIELQVWRSTDSCEEFWSWDECDQYDYDRAKPEDRRIICIVSENV